MVTLDSKHYSVLNTANEDISDILTQAKTTVMIVSNKFGGNEETARVSFNTVDVNNQQGSGSSTMHVNDHEHVTNLLSSLSEIESESLIENLEWSDEDLTSENTLDENISD